MPREGITVEDFARRVLLDPNFERGGALVARMADKSLAGFVLAIAPRSHAARTEPCRGWITLIAVAPSARHQGIGGRLLAAAEAYLIGRGCASIAISPYGPGYWIPGVDEAAYPEALGWLYRRGYAALSRPLAMEVALSPDWVPPVGVADILERLRRERVLLTPFRANATLPILELLGAEFGPDWVHTARDTMHAILAGYRPEDAIHCAMRGGECVGFAHWSGARFGPIGVTHSERGRGIGAALMYETLEAMRHRGQDRAFFLWTSDATADRLYRPAGFRETRRFHVLVKTLET